MCVLAGRYPPNGTLFDFLHSNLMQFYTEFQALRWATDIASAVSFLHSRHVIHGDLRSKPISPQKYEQTGMKCMKSDEQDRRFDAKVEKMNLGT